MKKIRIDVGSMTFAIKLKKILSRNGIKAYQTKWVGNGGCNHGVEIDERDLLSTIVLLREHNIEYSIENTEK